MKLNGKLDWLPLGVLLVLFRFGYEPKNPPEVKFEDLHPDERRSVKQLEHNDKYRY